MRNAIILLFAIVGTIISLVAQQNPGTPKKMVQPIDYRVRQFEVKDIDFIGAISLLSHSQMEELHLGVEETLRNPAADHSPLGPKFSLALHDRSLRELLDILCSHDNRYTWSQDGATINIYPKETVHDNTYLLNRTLEQIAVKDIPDPEQALTFLDKQLPPPREQLGYAGTGGDSSYSVPWTTTFSQLTVRQFINRLSEHMGYHTSWVFSGTKQERFFTFLKGGFH